MSFSLSGHDGLNRWSFFLGGRPGRPSSLSTPSNRNWGATFQRHRIIARIIS